MALSLSNFLVTLVLLLVNGLRVAAETHNFDWNITWVTANPDGLGERPVIGINGQWPLPLLNMTKGDQVIASVTNQLGNQSTSMHFHGLFQNGTNDMDGPQGVTQCGIPPNSTFVYNFTLTQSGTYWYHSHTRGQYPDGLRQTLIINDPENPYAGQYDEEIAISLSDWYHDQMPGLIDSFINVENPTGAEPVPNSALMNDTQNLTVAVEPGKTYLFRMANVAAFAGQYFWIEGHSMKVVEVDGVFTEAAETDMIYLTAAQRYSFLVTAKNTTDQNFAMMGSMDTDLFDSIPDDLNWNVTGWLVYDKTADMPAAAEVDNFDPLDDMILVPTDGLALYDHVDHSIELDLAMINLDDGANYAAFNNVPYVSPKVPTLYTVMSSGAQANDVSIYGAYTNSFVLQKDEVVEIIMNNGDTGRHPFHLHGHTFQAVYRSEDNGGFYNSTNETSFPAVPMRRDTLMVRPQGNFVIRFKADNPGVWLFHCHIDWHMDSGLVATMIEAPVQLQQSLVIPQNHYDNCKAGDTPYIGNAAGNTQDYTDLKGQPKAPGYIPDGFTARGIVALVFSIISALLGMVAIAWYGAAPLEKKEGAGLESKVEELSSAAVKE